MSPVPFTAGQCGDLRGGVSYRVRQGRKGPTDLVLDIRGPYQFTPLSMDLGLLAADFFFQNESRLYLRELGFDGGQRYLREVQAAVRDGWHPTVARLRSDQEKRRRRTAAA